MVREVISEPIAGVQSRPDQGAEKEASDLRLLARDLKTSPPCC